ncbi:ATPase, AAA family [Ostertagia ostertagi]
MVKRGNGLSPQKDLRRSSRERSMVYRSLAENDLAERHLRGSFMKSIIRTATAQLHKCCPLALTFLVELNSSQELIQAQPAAGYTRSGRRIAGSNHYEESDSSDEREYEKTRRRRYVKEVYTEESVRSPSPKRVSVRRRDLREVGDHHEEEQSAQGDPAQYDIEAANMYDTIKRERKTITSDFSSNSPTSINGNHSKGASESARSLRHANRERMSTGDAVKDEPNGEVEGSQSSEETDEDDEEKTPEPRQYSLRKFRQPVDRFAATVTLKEKESHRFREERNERTRGRSTDRRDRKAKRSSKRRRRDMRSDSSSTSSSGSSDDRIRTRNDDVRFERRKERSLAKARDRYMPINLNAKDLTSSQAVIRERLRQTGGSCTDIDPMSIDKGIGFEQVGGLGAHIQSLKEVVLFPMLYPEIFKQFNITPPKGVVFYGPPGTGKTLMARALANECSKGGKKVAFFMRKGADCLSKWVGEAERQLRVLFDQAYAMRPSIIFFDEIDGLAPVRSSKQDQIHSSIVSTLLALMDGLDNRGEVVVIGATNRLDTLDPALRRPGRFDRELKFSLPDANARKQILTIHTAKWGACQPDESTLTWLAEGTSGYCGADLQYLCTEAVLVALRYRFPHIYMSEERLKLDPSLLVVDRNCFTTAMRRITPASRRDLSIPSRQLDDRTSILLLSTVTSLLNVRIPSGYKSSQSVQNSSASELEKVVRALEQPPCVPAVRLLICGSPSHPDLGQTSYVLPAVLGKLDHLPVFSLAVARLFADGRPEETLAQTIQSALRSAANGPCVLLLPSIDQWYAVVPPSVTHMLATALDSMHGFTSILFLASCDRAYDSCCSEIKDLFCPSQSVSLSPPKELYRRHYFEHIIANARIPPKVFDPSLYKEPEKAGPVDTAIERKLNEREARELVKEYESQLRRFRIWARDKLSALRRDRRFTIFVKPVDVEDVEDYYDVIKNPMCISEMEDKIDSFALNDGSNFIGKNIFHPDHLLSDIRLIRDNAIEYNPATTEEGRIIRHNAHALWETVVDLFDVDLDVDFVESLENNAKMLADAGAKPTNEKLLELPPGFKRTVPWSVNAGYMTQIVKEDSESKKNEKPIAPQRTLANGMQRVRFRSRRKNGYAFPNSARRERQLLSSVDDSSEEPTSQGGTDDELVENGVPMEIVVDEKKKPDSPSKKSLVLSEAKLAEVVNKCVERTHGWSVTELERLAAVIAHDIEEYRDKWDRSKLPSKLIATITSWEMDFQNRAGGKTGGGGVASAQDAGVDRRERLRQLALETIDLQKDPYFMRNHLGTYECKLCLTLHNNEGSYLAHTQGKKHQSNLARRAAKEAQEQPFLPAPAQPKIELRKFVKIGRPGYKVTRERDPATGQQALLFQIDYPEIAEGIQPRHRFMSAYEQKIQPPDKRWQYLLFAAEPYETIGFKIPSRLECSSLPSLFLLFYKSAKRL